MKRLRPFKEFVKDMIVRKISPDKERAKSLFIEAERKTRSLNTQLERIGVNDDNANDYVEYSYDIMMFLIRAKPYLEGYSASGQGAHEAEVSFLSDLGFAEKDIQFADRIRYFRNGILYYGTVLDKEYADKVLEFTNKACEKLRGFLQELI